MNALVARLTFAFALTFTISAQAQQHELVEKPARFSDAGRLLVAGTINGHWAQENAGGWGVQIAPYLTYFVRDRLGVGLSPSYTTGRQLDGATMPRFHQAGIEAHALYDVPIAERVSLLVVPAIGYAYRKINAQPPFDLGGLQSGAGMSSFTIHQLTEEQLVTFALQTPFVYHASSSVVVGIGPFVRYGRVVGHPQFQTTPSGPQDTNLSTHSFGGGLRNFVEVGMSTFIGASF